METVTEIAVLCWPFWLMSAGMMAGGWLARRQKQ